jgi:mRNA (guanine-N7-)-methyltransferase
LPSWSGPSPSSRLPSEGDSSYFPPQDDRQRQGSNVPSRRGSFSSGGRMSTTPVPGYDRASGTPVEARAGSSLNGANRHVSGASDGLPSRKRQHDPEAEYAHDVTRRKVSDHGAYVGNASQVASHCECGLRR